MKVIGLTNGKIIHQHDYSEQLSYIPNNNVDDTDSLGMCDYDKFNCLLNGCYWLLKDHNHNSSFNYDKNSDFFTSLGEYNNIINSLETKFENGLSFDKE